MAYGGQIVLGPSNDYYGLNPLTGQWERVFVDYSTVSVMPESGEWLTGPTHYLESERPAGVGQRMTYKREPNSGIEFGVKAGLGAMISAIPGVGPILNGVFQTAANGGNGTGDYLRGAAGGYVGGEVGGAVGNAVGGGLVGTLAGGAASGATSSAIRGGGSENLLAGALTGAAGAGLGYGANALLGGDVSTGTYDDPNATAYDDSNWEGNTEFDSSYADLGGGAVGGTAGENVTAGAAGDDPMWDWLDENTWTTENDPNAGAYDDSNWGGNEVMGGGSVNFEDPSWFDSIKGAITDAAGKIDWGKAVAKLGTAGINKLINGLMGGADGGAGSGGLGLGSLGNAALIGAPTALALYQANQQRQDIKPYLDRLNTLAGQYAGNESAYMKSITDPYDQQTAQGLGNLTQSLGQRGVLGSSFGNMDLGNYGYMRDLGRGNLLAQARAQSTGVQSGLAGQSMQAINQRNLASNALIGAGLGASGSLFKANKDPFDLSKLLSMSMDQGGILG